MEPGTRVAATSSQIRGVTGIGLAGFNRSVLDIETCNAMGSGRYSVQTRDSDKELARRHVCEIQERLFLKSRRD